MLGGRCLIVLCFGGGVLYIAFEVIIVRGNISGALLLLVTFGSVAVDVIESRYLAVDIRCIVLAGHEIMRIIT